MLSEEALGFQNRFVFPEETAPDRLPLVRSRLNQASKDRLPIVLLHEITGLDAGILRLAEEIERRGHFKVIMPIMFGPDHGVSENEFYVMAGRTAEWKLQKGSRPIFELLRREIRQVAAENPGKPIGVIGMCFTGSVALAMLSEPEVRATVSSQPVLPMFAPVLMPLDQTFCTLGIPGSDLEHAVERVKNGTAAPPVAMRFETDPLSPKRHLQVLRREFGDEVLFDWTISRKDEYFDRNHDRIVPGLVPNPPHSILNGNLVLRSGSSEQPLHPTEKRLDAVVAYFTHYLERHPGLDPPRFQAPEFSSH